MTDTKETICSTCKNAIRDIVRYGGRKYTIDYLACPYYASFISKMCLHYKPLTDSERRCKNCGSDTFYVYRTYIICRTCGNIIPLETDNT